jgi:hypothetical protein
MPFIKYLGVFVMGMFKFIIAPITGFGLGLGFVETFVCMVSGMMLSVALFSYLGNYIKLKVSWCFPRRRILFNPRTRRIVYVWQNYGLWGIALLTPIILSPIVGTLIASSFGETPFRIMYVMFISALIWGVILLAILYGFGEHFFQV